MSVKFACPCSKDSAGTTASAIRPALTALHATLTTLNVIAQQQPCCWLQVSTGEVSVIGASRGYTAVSPSPDGRFLLVAWLERPFSFAVPCGRFPKTVQLWTR